MRRRIALLVVLFSAPAVTATVLGQDRSPTTLFSQCGAIHLEIVLGRIMVVPRHRGQTRTATDPDSSSPVRESLVVNNDATESLVRYEQTSEDRTLVVEVVGQRRVSIRSQQSGESARTFEFSQPVHGDLRLVVQDAEGTRELSGAGVWQLLLTERRLVEETLIESLEQLRPHWQLAAMSDRLQAELFHRAQTERPLARRELELLVSELDSTRYQHRQRADQQLRSYGPRILPYLDRVLRQSTVRDQRLSNEQRDRLLRIRQGLTLSSVDTPARVSQWLIDDDQTWLALLKHQDPERRHVASIRLAALRPDAIQFDPYGDESYRQQQLAQLQLQIRR